MKFATRLNVTATVAAGVISTLTLGSAVLGRRTLQQEIDAGNAANDTTAIKVGDTGVPFMVENLTTGDWEAAYYTITSGTVITKGAIIASSNAGAAVSFPAGAVNVFNTPLGGWLRRLITIDDAVSMPGLPLGTATSNGLLLQYNPATGNTETVTVASLLALVGGSAPSGGATSQSITVNTIATQTAGAAFSVTGTYANGTPTALQWSINGSTWNNATATISGGTFTITGVTVPAASNSQTVMVRDATTLVSGTSAAFLVNAAPYITTNTPNSQVVNAAFPVTGWYYNYTPTAFDYRFSDDTAGVWTQAAAGTTSITGGAWQISVTCATTNTSRTITVRDRTTQAILATSGAFSVAAGAATVTGVAVLPSPATVIGGKTQQFTATVGGTNSPSQSVTWSLVSGVGSIDANGLYTAPAATTAAQNAVIKAVSLQDGTTASPNVSITVPAQTITVTTPATQTVGAAYPLAGSWTGLQPTALQYQYADNGGTATAWATLTGATINANGTWSASVTPTAASTSRVMSVRDASTLIQGSSAAYVVNAAVQKLSDTFRVTNSNGASLAASTTSATARNPDWSAAPTGNIRVNVRDSSGNPATAAQFKLIFVPYNSTTSPITFGQGSLAKGGNGTTDANGHNNAIGTPSALNWSAGQTGSGTYGTYQTSTTMYAWFGNDPAGPFPGITSGQSVDMKLLAHFSDESIKALGVDDTGSPIKFTFTVP